MDLADTENESAETVLMLTMKILPKVKTNDLINEKIISFVRANEPS